MNSDSADLRRFAEELSEEVLAKREADFPGSDPLFADTALGAVMLEYLEDQGLTVESELCPFADATGRRRCSITAYAFNENEDRLDLFLATHLESANGNQIPTLSTSSLSQLAGKAARFFDYAAKKEWERFEGLPEVLDAARNIHAQLDRLGSVRIFLLTNALVRDRDVEDLEVCGVGIRFEVVDLERLHRISKDATSRQDIVVDFVAMNGRPLACLEMTPRAAEYETYLAILSGNMLFSLYEKYGQRLFEFNVRAFLQAKGKVNKGIRDSLRDFPDRFMAYNNGIVATADHLEVETFHGETCISKITGLQIVNGAQTTASIYRAKKAEKIDLGKVAVAVKITKLASEKLQEFVPLISRYANTQNVIQVADLSANNEFHIALERLSEQIWCPGEETRWFYERARGAYQDALQREGSTSAKRREFKGTTPPSKKLTKTDLAKCLVAWMGRPHIVSLGAQKNFSVFMAELPELFPEDWKPDREFYKRCVAQAILYRTCERIVRAKKFAAYRANIAVYTYALLSHVTRGQLNLDNIWEAQEVPASLHAALEGWTDLVDKEIRKSAGAKNITEWCKKAECWEAVRSLPVMLPSEPGQPKSLDISQRLEIAAAAPIPNSVEDEEAIEECMRHDASTWAKLNFWGISSNALDYYERGVAHTLSEYAALGWTRRPSAKQARIGIRVLHRGKDANLF
jgi:hypothetical protein